MIGMCCDNCNVLIIRCFDNYLYKSQTIGVLRVPMLHIVILYFSPVSVPDLPASEQRKALTYSLFEAYLEAFRVTDKNLNMLYVKGVSVQCQEPDSLCVCMFGYSC